MKEQWFVAFIFFIVTLLWGRYFPPVMGWGEAGYAALCAMTAFLSGAWFQQYRAREKSLG